MKGYTIDVRNNLLETKHFVNMGEAVWLYMWLLDKMTSVNENGVGKVLGNTPITHEMVHKDLGVPRSTYYRYLVILRKYGYINTLKSPRGAIITISKAKKNFSKTTKIVSPKNETPKTSESQNRDSGVPKMAQLSPKNETPLYIDDNSTVDNTEDSNNTTNVVGAEAPKTYGKVEINQAFEYWNEKVGYAITGSQQNNRRACYNLIRKHGAEALRQLIDGVALAADDRYAPRISDFVSLQAKLNDLMIWGRKRNNQGVIHVS